MATRLRRFYGLIRPTLVVLSVIQLAGCDSQQDRARSYYERGMKLMSEHDNARAAIELRNAVRLKRDLIEAWKALAKVDETNNDWRHVVTDLRTIVELAPGDVSARLKLGKLLLLTGSSNEALSLANAGLDLDNSNADLHALRAVTVLKLGDRAGAVHDAEAALRLDPTNADALMVLAEDRLDGGDTKGALSILEGTSVADAKSLENNLGLQLLKIKLFGKMGDTQSVESTLKRLVELNPQEFGYRKLLVNFYLEQRRINDAEREMRSSVAANPSNSVTALDLVQFLYTVKRTPAAARRELDDRVAAGGEVFPFQLALADMDFADGNLTAATQLLENLIRTSRKPEQIQTARLALARMYLGSGSLGPAEKVASDILRDDPRSASALTIRASIFLQHSKVDAAVADLLNALNYQPRSVEVSTLLATAYERSGLIELADKQFADATRLSNYNINVSLQYVEFLRRRGSLARAEDILVGLTKQLPDNLQVLSTLAEFRLARRNWSGAQDTAESIRRTGKSAVADQILGTALIGRGRYDEAITVLQRSYQAEPEAGQQPISSLVTAFLKADKKDQALAFLKSVLAKNPSNANALVLLGTTQLASGATDIARNSFLAAVNAQPKDPVGYQALADLYLRERNYDGATKIVGSGIQQRPDSMTLQMALANVLEQKGDYEGAISQYQSILDKQPGNLIVANNVASLLLEHRTDQASLKKATSVSAILRKSSIPQFKDTLCWVSYRQGDYQAAVSLCEEAAAALPHEAAVLFHLGMSYAAISKPDKASEQLEKALQLAPQDRLAELIRTALKKVGQQSSSSTTRPG
jgi:cellulose synthase operon protein C